MYCSPKVLTIMYPLGQIAPNTWHRLQQFMYDLRTFFIGFTHYATTFFVMLERLFLLLRPAKKYKDNAQVLLIALRSGH